jgi:hypothetical protein
VPMINKPNDNSVIWYNGNQYPIIDKVGLSYRFMIGADKYTTAKIYTSRNDQGVLVAIEAYLV